MAAKKKATQAKRKMTDVQLAKLAQEHSELKAKIKSLEAKAEKRKAAIVKEMETRGLKAMETEEVRVSVVQKSNVNYDVEKLKERLGPRRYRAIVSEHVDKDKLARAVQDGKVNMKDVDKASTVSWNRPYIVVSPRGKDA